MAEPTGTVENSSVLIINHPPSSVMRDWSFYTHRTTQCHSKYGWKITPNSLPSKWTQSRRGLEFFFFFSCTQVQKKKKGKRKCKHESTHVWLRKCMLHTHTCKMSVTYTHLPTSKPPSSTRWQLQNTIFCTNICIKITKKTFIFRLLPWTSEEMQHERATGSVCEVNSTGPLF